MHFSQFSRRILSVKDQIQHIFHNSPRLANAITGFATFSAGDVLIQRYEKKRFHEIDYLRSFELGLLGLVMNGYFLVSWYKFLDRAVGHSMSCATNVTLKVIADQVVYAPFSIVAFFGFSSMIRHFNTSEAIDYFDNKIRSHFWTTFLADCSVWPAVNAVNFRFISLAYRPTFTAVIQLMWQAYMSFVADSKRRK